MPQKQDNLRHITGTAAKAPEKREFDSGRSVVSIFTIVTLRYGDKENQKTQPVVVQIWDRNADLQEYAMENIDVGSPIAAEGYLDTERSKYPQLSVVRIGTVAWAKRANNGQSSSKPKAKEEDSSDDLEGGW